MSHKKSHFETSIDQEINKREARLSSLINDKLKLLTELETLRKTRELYIQSRKRQKIETGVIVKSQIVKGENK